MALIAGVNDLYPKRDRGADGIVGDQSHQAGTGDHTCKVGQYYNPGGGLYVPGYAHAVDLDEDGWPALGFYRFTLAEARAGRRPWIKYAIYENVLQDRYRGWARQSGFGHTRHMHFSIDGGRGAAWTLKRVDWFAGWATSPYNPDRADPKPIAAKGTLVTTPAASLAALAKLDERIPAVRLLRSYPRGWYAPSGRELFLLPATKMPTLTKGSTDDPTYLRFLWELLRTRGLELPDTVPTAFAGLLYDAAMLYRQQRGVYAAKVAGYPSSGIDKAGTWGPASWANALGQRTRRA